MSRVPRPREIRYGIRRSVRRARLAVSRRLRRSRDLPGAVGVPGAAASSGPRARVRRSGAAVRDRARSTRYLLADVAFVIGRIPRAIGRGARGFWYGLALETRRRLALALAAVAVLAVIWLVAVPALPCQFPGGDRCPPSDDAIGLAPADSLAYLHVNVDQDTEQFQDAADALSGLPTVTQQIASRLLARVPGPNGSPPSLAEDIRPWFGGEAALAVLPGPGRVSEEVQMLEAADEGGARAFADSIAAGTPETSTYQGVEISTDQRGLATAVTDGFLIIGRETGVREVIDAATGASGATSLADDDSAQSARDALPDKRLADAYLSEDGIAQLVGASRGSLATLGPFVSPEASQGAAIALVADDGGALDLDIRSELDPEREKAQPGFFTAFPAFDPKLPDSIQADSLGYLGIGDPGEAFAALLQQATAQQPGLAEAFGALFDRLKKLGHVDLQSDLFPSLGGEAALGLQPTSATPFLEFIGTDVDTEAASKALAKLQGPIAHALSESGGGQAPVFNQRKIGDVQAQSLRLSPTVDLTYALFDSMLAVATDPAGVEQLVAGEGGLGSSDGFENATDGFPDTVALEGYLDLTGVIGLAEKAGLAESPAYTTYAPEIRKLEGLGLAVTQSPSELATDVRLTIAPGPPESSGVARPNGGD